MGLLMVKVLHSEDPYIYDNITYDFWPFLVVLSTLLRIESTILTL